VGHQPRRARSVACGATPSAVRCEHERTRVSVCDLPMAHEHVDDVVGREHEPRRRHGHGLVDGVAEELDVAQRVALDALHQAVVDAVKVLPSHAAVSAALHHRIASTHHHHMVEFDRNSGSLAVGDLLLRSQQVSERASDGAAAATAQRTSIGG